MCRYKGKQKLIAVEGRAVYHIESVGLYNDHKVDIIIVIEMTDGWYF